jgi:Integrase core domain
MAVQNGNRACLPQYNRRSIVMRLFNEKVREWEDYYNYHRPHGALQGQTPFERLIEKSRADVSRGSLDPTKVEFPLSGT